MMIQGSKLPLLNAPKGKLATRKKGKEAAGNDVFSSIYREEEKKYDFSPASEPFIEAQWEEENDWSSVTEPRVLKLYQMMTHLKMRNPIFLSYYI